MFELPEDRITTGTFHRFYANHRTLERDSELELLSTGTNESNAHIISSFLTYDDDADRAKYFHAVVSPRVFLGFMSGSKTLLDVLNDCLLLFVVEKDSDGNEFAAWMVGMDQIPEKYRPLPGSFCPVVSPVASLVYTAELSGGTANDHVLSKAAFTAAVEKLVDFFSESTHDLFERLRLRASILLRPPSIASFEMEFVLDVTQSDGALFAQAKDLDLLVKSIYSYMLVQLPKGGSAIDTSTKEFAKLRTQAITVFEQQYMPVPKDVDDVIVKSIKKSLPILSELDFGKDFDEVQIRNEVADVKQDVGVVDPQYVEETRSLVDAIALEEADDVKIDPNEKDYTVQVFYFNRDSGNGAAYYLVDQVTTKIKVYARGLKVGYSKTKFSHSLDTGKPVVVEGKGKWVNGELRSVTVQLKP